MSRTSVDWASRIGRRLALRDLHVFFTVVQRGSMAKAAQQLNISQPAVSKVIADLEHTLGVRLLDRRPNGVEPTIYGQALLKRGNAVFDELKESIRDIEFLADPTAGEVRIGCGDGVAVTILPPIIKRFSQQYPRVVLRIMQPTGIALDSPTLRERTVDFVLLRMSRAFSEERVPDDLNVDVLLNDQLIIAVGRQNPLARRRKMDLAELVNEPWIMSGPGTWNHDEIAGAFRARGLAVPKISLETLSLDFRTTLLANGTYVATFPRSVLLFHPDRFLLKALPVDLPVRPWPMAIITLKNRTLSPVVERFIGHLRDFTQSICAKAQRPSGSPLRSP
jgi:DNA-binding transcriptional LysR family regulator